MPSPHANQVSSTNLDVGQGDSNNINISCCLFYCIPGPLAKYQVVATAASGVPLST